jgi:thiol-disulfide isomerase/thioredoxin
MNRLIVTCCFVALLGACKPSADHAAVPGTPATPAAPTAATRPAARATPASPEVPVLKVTTLDGAQYDLAAHRGKWVVVNFWATWCGPCLKEMPELSALDAMREHVDVIGLAYDDIEPAALKAFLQAHPVVYPIALVDTYKPPADFATPRGLPTSYLIAPDGHVARQFLGPVTAKDIEAAIAAAGGPKTG